MQNFMLETAVWTRFRQKFDELAAARRQKARLHELLERAGDRLTAEVRQSIRRSGLHDSRGRVQSWQNPHIGSRLGYVAIRPDSVEVSAGGNGRQQINTGALTNYLSSGHETRTPSGRSQRYKPRVHMAVVPGFGFYSDAGQRAAQIGLEEAQQLLDEMIKELPK